MPDSSYADHDVEVVYEQLQDCLRSRPFQNWRYLVAGDLDAEVGAQGDLDDPAILGPGGLPARNEQGELLLQMCTRQGLVLGNTHFDTHSDKFRTLKNGALGKQLDYILRDLQPFPRVRWCQV